MWNYWLFARANFSDVSRSARESSSMGNAGFVIAVLVGIVTLGGGLYYWSQHRKVSPQGSSNPQTLFQELCHLHQLSRSERALLLRVFESLRLAQPAILFVDPSILESIKKSPSPESQTYAALANKLFGPGST